jgi:hypothetical protein
MQIAHSQERTQAPDDEALARICRRAAADYPGVDPMRIYEFLVAADDPAWCTERIARQVAGRMAEGLIG